VKKLESMPKKIRELKQLLSKAGFAEQPAKGIHTKWTHPQLNQTIVLSGKDGSDAKPYQEKRVKQALETLKRLTDNNEEQN